MDIVKEQACQRALKGRRTLMASSSATCGLLEHLQRRVALEPFSEGGCISDIKFVSSQPASAGKEAGAQRALTQRQTLQGGGALQSEVTALPLSPSHRWRP